MIDLFQPYIPKEAIEAVCETMRTRWIGQGPQVDQFEALFAKMFGLKNVVSMNSGTSALETAYELIGLKEGDEVISTPLTCTATNLPLLRRGCKIVWADIDPKTLCIDGRDVMRKITNKTKAVVQVHLGGIDADIGRLFTARIPLVSDACQALGIFNGDYTCCSFQAIKHITTGDGGMLVCMGLNRTTHARDAKLMRWFGIDREKKIANNWQAYKERKMTFDIEIPGTKRHMTDLAAAMGIHGLRNYDHVICHRSKLFSIYKKSLRSVPGIKLIDGKNNTYWLATVLVDRRDDFARVMFEAGIDTNVVQVRNDIYKVFGGVRAELPVLNELEEQYLSLPIGMHVKPEEVEYICETIKKGW